MDPKVEHEFAQCATCWKFTGKTCLEFSSKDIVKPTGSCGLYCVGKPQSHNIGKENAGTTPEIAGYVDRKVRCEHCEFFEEGDNDCLLFRTLNIKNYKVDPDGCCNAQQPKDDEESSVKKLKTPESAQKITIKKKTNPFAE